MEAEREALVDALARDAYAVLAVLDARTLPSEVKKAAELAAPVVGQDLEQPDDGVFRIARRVQHSSGRLQAPHLSVTTFVRGLLKPAQTRLYFPDEPSNAADPVLAAVPEARRQTAPQRSPSARWLSTTS